MTTHCGSREKRAREIGAERGVPTPTAQLLTMHGLESFLDRLTRTRYKHNFVLKGGVLLAAYEVRRPTKDVDAEAFDTDITTEFVDRVVREIAALGSDDGLTFQPDGIAIQEIRESADYPGMRVRIPATLGVHKVRVSWDISTGDPMIPDPRLITIKRVIGADIHILGYAPETIVAEKGVTILERGITSTRWRDYVDIVQLAAQQPLKPGELRRSAEAIAAYRGVELSPVSRMVAGYGAVGQTKWAAWRRKESVESLCEALLDDQMVRVAAVLDPVFGAQDGS